MTLNSSAGSDERVVIRTEIDTGIQLLEMNRPQQLNAITSQMLDEFHAELDALARDQSCRIVILTGRGRGFCAGLDLHHYRENRRWNGDSSAQALLWSQQRIATLVPKLRALPQPVIAAVNGPASGGGLALALAADIRISGPDGRFGAAFVRIGLSGCDIGVSWLLPRLVGASRAFELLLSGRIIDAEEAARIGLITRLVGDGEVISAAVETAVEIRANSPMGVRMTKEVMWHQLEISSLEAGIGLENHTQVVAGMTRDHEEAVAAFTERRPPEFVDD